MAGPFFRAFQLIQKVFGRGAGKVRLFDQRPFLMSDPPDSAVIVITPRVTKVVLSVIDDGVVPIGDVHRAVGTDFDIDRPKIRMA